MTINQSKRNQSTRGFEFGYSYCRLKYLQAKQKQADFQDKLIRLLITVCILPIILFIILI